MADPDPIAEFNAQATAKGWPMRFTYARDFENPNLAALLDLWNSEARNGIPPRAQFPARVLKPYLPNISVVERDRIGDHPTYRFRLIGTELARLFGDRTGEALEEALPAPFVERWSVGYDAILAARRPIRVVTQFELPQVSYLDGESLHAPLRSNDGEVSLILSATYLKARVVSQRPANTA